MTGSKNSEVQLPRCKATCPTLYRLLTESLDGIMLAKKNGENDYSVCRLVPMTGIIPLLSITKEVLDINRNFVNTMTSATNCPIILPFQDGRMDWTNCGTKMTPIKNISEVTEPLKEQILKGDVHTIDEMRAWLKPLGYSDTINEAAINFILREFVMSKVSSDSMMNADMVVELLRPQLEVTKEDIEPVIIMGLYHHRNLIGSRDAFIKVV